MIFPVVFLMLNIAIKDILTSSTPILGFRLANRALAQIWQASQNLRKLT
jgi:hypothetical protein